ncbi:MAG TPA: bi-domain-containing oxidoreductase [Pyrinomonadaceae bacterium]|nr:bi-domain-containing oxidoreductase [Pyrinomonadaceae bacterium]
MKQILQNAKTGAVAVQDVPAPIAQPGFVLVRTSASLISAGTERLTVEAGQKNLVSRAIEQPALVKKVLDKARNEGVVATFDAVRSKLGSLTALGYSAAGTIAAIGEGVTDLRVGDRVACAGVGYASHAEVLSVPKNLCVRVPDVVDFDTAAFGTVGAIALQGLRLAEPTLGESVVVIGLGLIGQIAVQLLTANGCRVFGIDLDQQKIDLAKQLGGEDGCKPDDDATQRVLDWSRGRGADAVLITAATSSDQPVELAGEISRPKGRVVVVGAVGLNLPRKSYYDRELTFLISMSYGPGRYDRNYEERGQDYPFGYVRWTEGRNIEAFLDMMAAGRVNVEPLITHRFKIDDGERAYELITSDEPYLGVVLQYDATREVESRIPLNQKTTARSSGKAVRVGLIGAGDYAKSVLLPNFKAAGAEFQAIATASGVNARSVGEQHGFRFCASGAADVINDADVNLVVIASRHASHAALVRQALEAGKYVFVEKPLATSDQELDEVMAIAEAGSGLMVGFNRRFSPLSREAFQFFKNRQSPLSINYRVNAGRLSPNHWHHDANEGGRLIGEVCHFIDLVHFITGSLTTRVFAEAVADRNAQSTNEDSVFVTLRLHDGSNASIAYLSEGDKALPKERIEIFGGGKSFVIDDFRSATAYENGREKTTRLREQDKGQRDEVRAVMSMVLDGKTAPISLEDLKTTTRATFRIRESLQTGLPVEV